MRTEEVRLELEDVSVLVLEVLRGAVRVLQLALDVAEHVHPPLGGCLRHGPDCIKQEGFILFAPCAASEFWSVAPESLFLTGTCGHRGRAV